MTKLCDLGIKFLMQLKYKENDSSLHYRNLITHKRLYGQIFQNMSFFPDTIELFTECNIQNSSHIPVLYIPESYEICPEDYRMPMVQNILSTIQFCLVLLKCKSLSLFRGCCHFVLADMKSSMHRQGEHSRKQKGKKKSRNQTQWH